MEFVCSSAYKGGPLIRRKRRPYANTMDGSPVKRMLASVVQIPKTHAVVFFENLQSLRHDGVMCDVELVTDDGTKVRCHKIVLASVSPYFHAMFTRFGESTKDHVVLKDMDSTVLTLLLDFIYTAQLAITENNVKVLLPAAHFLQLQYVQDECCNFLQARLQPTNCIGIKALADMYGCTKLSSRTQTYILHNFSEVIGGDEFLTLSSEQLIELISNDELTCSSEENIFECVIRWVKYELDLRKEFLPNLMKHVRLPLVSASFFSKRVKKEPLLKKLVEYKNYIVEVRDFHSLMSINPDFIPNTIRTMPRRRPVILVVGEQYGYALPFCEWYDPATNEWDLGPEELSLDYSNYRYVIMKDRRVFSYGGNPDCSSINLIDFSKSSPHLEYLTSMLVERSECSIAVLDNYIYAVGGLNKSGILNSAEIFNINNRQQHMISNMCTARKSFGLGVLNNHLYAVGGLNDGKQCTNYCERYDPSTNTWTRIANMRVPRYDASVGVLDDVIYAIGGIDDRETFCNVVEAYTPSTGIWKMVSAMNHDRSAAGVVAFNGLLYVVGGFQKSSPLKSVEVYNPNTDSWSTVTETMRIARGFVGVAVINNPLYLDKKGCPYQWPRFSYDD